MTAVSAVLRGRAKAETLMVDTCTITRGSGDLVTDPDTGEVTAAGATIYPTAEHIAAGNNGKCKVQSKDSATASPEAGGHAFVVTITSSRLNAFTVGKQYRVEGFTPDSFDTAARLPVKEMTS